MDFDTALTLLFVCLPVFFALICFYYAIYFLKAARNIEDSPTANIRSAAQGYVELKGLPKPFNTKNTLGKLSQKPCAWYRYTIEVFQSTRSAEQPNAYWNLLEQGASGDPFLLDDGTGQCIIQQQGAEIIATHCVSWRGHTRIPSPPCTSFLLWLFWNNWGSYRYTEYRLEFDLPIYVSGRFSTLKSTDPRLQNSPVIKSFLTENNLSTCNVLLKEGLSQSENFLISAITEPHLIRQFKIKAFVFFVVFLFFTSLSVNNTLPIIKKSLPALKSNLLRNY